MLQDPKVKYEFLDQLSHAGADSADIVYRVRHRKTNQRYACKRISKHQLDYAGSCLRYLTLLPRLFACCPLLTIAFAEH